jgi:fluoride ion exporter CrcB/FEX
MLSYVWVSVRDAINSAASYWVSRRVAQRCGQTFPDDTRAAHEAGSFLTGLCDALAESKGRRSNLAGNG